MPAHRSFRPFRWLGALAAFVLVSPLSARADLLAPGSGTRFASAPTVNETTFQCLGVGEHEKGDGEHAVAFCVDEGQAELVDTLVEVVSVEDSGKGLEQRLAGDQRFFDALGEIPGDKLLMLHLTKDMKKDALAQMLRDTLGGALSKEKLGRLVEALPGDGSRGGTVLIYNEGSRLVIDMDGKSESVDDQEISSAVWSAWLGPKSVSPSLKSSIAHIAASESEPKIASYTPAP